MGGGLLISRNGLEGTSGSVRRLEMYKSTASGIRSVVDTWSTKDRTDLFHA